MHHAGFYEFVTFLRVWSLELKVKLCRSCIGRAGGGAGRSLCPRCPSMASGCRRSRSTPPLKWRRGRPPRAYHIDCAPCCICSGALVAHLFHVHWQCLRRRHGRDYSADDFQSIISISNRSPSCASAPTGFGGVPVPEDALPKPSTVTTSPAASVLELSWPI